MKKNVIYFSFFLLIFSLLADSDINKFSKNQPELIRTQIGNRDNPFARAMYEWKRLRNPATNEIPVNIRLDELAHARSIPSRESSFGLSKSSGAQALTWAPRGPFNIGGRTRALALDQNNENIILAGGVSSGMWRSTNGGTTWTKTTDPSVLHSVTTIAQDTTGGNTIWYYGTGEGVGNSASGGGPARYLGDGIFKSTDNGVTWTLLSATSTNTPQTIFANDFMFVWKVVVNPTNGDVYAATWNGVYKSINGGATWTEVLNTGGASTGSSADIVVTSTGILYAAGSSDGSGDKGIFRSADDGSTWADLTADSGLPGTYDRINLAIAPSNENIMYVIAETQGTGALNHSLFKYTYVSGDGTGGGGTWVNRTVNIPAIGGSVGDFDSQSGYDLYVRVKPNDPDIVFLGGTNLYRSTDGFASTGNTTWIGGYATVNDVSIYANHHPDQHELVFLPSAPNTMISGHDGGISKTTDNTASTVVWSSLNNGYVTTQFYTIALDHGTAGSNIVVGGLQDNSTLWTNTTNASTAWTDLNSGDGSYAAITDGGNPYYVSSQNGRVLRRTVNTSGVPTNFLRIDPATATGVLFINPFILNPSDTNMMFYAGGEFLWRNTDLVGTTSSATANDATSVNWTQLTNSQVSGSTISAIEVSKVNPSHKLYYGTDDGKVFRLDNANSGDPSPVDIWTGKGLPSGAYVSSIAVNRQNGDEALLIFSNYGVKSVFHTTDAGVTWTDVSGNLEQNTSGTGTGPSVRWGEIVNAGIGRTYYVGTSTGLYSTSKFSGTSTVWEQEGASNIGSVVVDMIDSRESDGRIVIGTHGNGVYSSVLDTALTPPILLKPGIDEINVQTNPTFVWQSVPAGTSYTFQLSTVDNFASTVSNQQVSDTTVQVSGLSEGTNYFWRVNAVGVSASTPFSSVRKFTTGFSVTTLIVDAIGNKSVTEGFRIDAQISVTYNGNKSLKYSLQSNIPPTETFSLDSKTGAFFWKPSFNASGVYSLTFTVTDGTLSDSETIQLTVIDKAPKDGFSAPDTTLINSASGGTVKVKGSGAYTQHKVRIPAGVLPGDRTIIIGPPLSNQIPDSILLQVPSAIDFTVVGSESGFVFDDSVEITIEFKDFEIDSDSQNLRIHIWDASLQVWKRILGNHTIDLDGNTVTAKVLTFSIYGVLEVPEFLQENTLANGWNMISLPVEPSSPNDPESIFGDDISPFRTEENNSNIYTYDEAANDWIIPSTVENARGYIVYGFNANTTTDIPGLEMTADISNTLTLTNDVGWNLLGNPYNVDIDWDTDIALDAGIDPTYYRFTGSEYEFYPGGGLTSTISPWEGFFVHTSVDDQEMDITYPGLSKKARDIAPEIDWRIRISGESGDNKDTHNYLGVSNTAKDDYDIFDKYELVSLNDEFISVYFPHEDWNTNPANYTQDIRQAGDELVWDMEVLNKGSEDFVTLSWSIPDDIKDTYHIILVDEAAEKEVDMEQITEYTISVIPAVAKNGTDISDKLKNPAHFAKAFGGKNNEVYRLSIKMVRAGEDNALVPDDYFLDQNFPNPFNPSTTIKYGLPEAGPVTLKIFNMLGQEVKTIVNTQQNAGTHHVLWNGTNNSGIRVASGVYIYRISANNFTQVRKLLLIK